MKDFKTTIKNKANIVMGKAKSAAGNILGDEELQLKGKLQTAEGMIREKSGLSLKTVAIVLIGATALLIVLSSCAGSADIHVKKN